MKLSILSSITFGVASVMAGSASVCPSDNTHTTGAALQSIVDYKKGDHQLMAGYFRSCYEENGANWGDTTSPITSSRAWQYAKWQPSGATKGGIFSYAIDRDGVPIGDDKLQPTDFTWTRKLISAMNP
ncbi:hypothetical protein MY1884_008973 [Beauveria asiatica]